MALTLTRTVSFAANEPDTTLAKKFRDALELATWSGMDETNFADPQTCIQRVNNLPGSPTVGRVYQDFGPTYPQPYRRIGDYFGLVTDGIPEVCGVLMKNSTGGTRVLGDVVGRSGGVGGLEFDADSNSPIVGVVGQQTIAAGAYGLILFKGRALVKVTGAVTRGSDFLLRNTVGGSYNAIAGPAFANSFGLIITAASGGFCQAILRTYNQ